LEGKVNKMCNIYEISTFLLTVLNNSVILISALKKE